MRTRYRLVNNEDIYFITSTIVGWISIFNQEKYFNILLDSIRYCQNKKELKVYAYVILKDHFHMIVSNNHLSCTMASLKGFSAKKIIEQLKADKKKVVLQLLEDQKRNYKKESTYQVWQEGFHPQVISSYRMLNQKIDYIHFNPVKRSLVSRPEMWRYSSAKYYLLGVETDIRIDVL
jgi:putative transposase